MNNLDQLKAQALSLLRKFYGYSNLYPMQWQVISHVLEGNDAVVLMPTGGGKSMCFQLPALMGQGCTLVVTPLLALMKDQVDALQANGIPAASINSQQSDTENRIVMENVYAGHIKLLYVSPEKLLADVASWAETIKITLIAIDEAHCISQWGHDFRPEYTRLHVLKDFFPEVPVIALTATADRITRMDIRKQLGIPNAKIFISSFDRPNISLNVITNASGRDKMRQIVKFLDRHRGESGIIYCLSRKNTEKMATDLQRLGFTAQAFHAGMPTDYKLKVQREFINDEIQIICATIAFGMGIDKSNVRWVIHSNMPRNIEGYYQEIGRAGRDGMPAEALMFYSYADVMTLQHFAQESGQSTVNMEKLQRMQQYAEASVCRRRMLLSYFNERYDTDCHHCDVCSNPPERVDGTVIAQMALSAMWRTGQNVGFNMVIDILRASRKAELVQAGYDKLKTYGVGRDLTYAEWNAYLLQMLQMGLIEVAYNENNHLKITDYGNEVLHGKRKVDFTRYMRHAKVQKETKKKQEVPTLDGMPGSDRQLYELLREKRLELAREASIPPYMVFSDKVLTIMAQEKPTTKAQFGMLYGVGEFKVARYWQPFTQVINAWLGRQ